MTWHGLTASYTAAEEAQMRELAELGKGSEAWFLHELKARFDATITTA